MPPVFNRQRVRQLKAEIERDAFDVFRQGRFSGSRGVRDKRIRAWCGCSASVIARAWYLLEQGHLEPQASRERLLWALHMLNCYPNEREGAARCGGVDEGTYRKWVWYFVEELAYLEDDVVSRRHFSFCLPY